MTSRLSLVVASTIGPEDGGGQPRTHELVFGDLRVPPRLRRARDARHVDVDRDDGRRHVLVEDDGRLPILNERPERAGALADLVRCLRARVNPEDSTDARGQRFVAAVEHGVAEAGHFAGAVGVCRGAQGHHGDVATNELHAEPRR